MNMNYNNTSLTRWAATIAGAFGIEPPAQADGPDNRIAGLIAEKTGNKPVDRVLVYNPDAIAMWLYNKYKAAFAQVLEHTQIEMPLASVMPPVTPVCFATMYTGVLPEIHGITKYEKRLVTTDSLFDAAARAGKKAAIVAVEDSSMAKIFQNRDIDYYTLPYDNEVKEKALLLIAEDRYDFISVYTQEYDDVMHKKGPESEQALQAMRNQIDIFGSLAAATQKHWRGHDSLICFSTDHGVHPEKSGRGAHGEDIPEDINITHFLGVTPVSRSDR